MRKPPVQDLKIRKVKQNNDGTYNVKLLNGAFLTVHPEDLPRPPEAGDYVQVQLPIVIGFVDIKEMEA